MAAKLRARGEGFTTMLSAVKGRLKKYIFSLKSLKHEFWYSLHQTLLLKEHFPPATLPFKEKEKNNVCFKTF